MEPSGEAAGPRMPTNAHGIFAFIVFFLRLTGMPLMFAEQSIAAYGGILILGFGVLLSIRLWNDRRAQPWMGVLWFSLASNVSIALGRSEVLGLDRAGVWWYMSITGFAVIALLRLIHLRIGQRYTLLMMTAVGMFVLGQLFRSQTFLERWRETYVYRQIAAACLQVPSLLSKECGSISHIHDIEMTRGWLPALQHYKALHLIPDLKPAYAHDPARYRGGIERLFETIHPERERGLAIQGWAAASDCIPVTKVLITADAERIPIAISAAYRKRNEYAGTFEGCGAFVGWLAYPMPTDSPQFLEAWAYEEDTNTAFSLGSPFSHAEDLRKLQGIR